MAEKYGSGQFDNQEHHADKVRMKVYTDDLLKRLGDASNWIGHDQAAFEAFGEAQDLAIRAIEKGTLEGALAGMLLLHQLTEDWVDRLLELNHFYMQLRLFPLPFRSNRKKKMFGQKVRELEETVWFQQRDGIVKRAIDLNESRVPLVHGLTKPGAIAQAMKSVKRSLNKYNEFSFLAYGGYLLLCKKIYDEFAANRDFPPRDLVYLNDSGRVIAQAE